MSRQRPNLYCEICNEPIRWTDRADAWGRVHARCECGNNDEAASRVLAQIAPLQREEPE